MDQETEWSKENDQGNRIVYPPFWQCILESAYQRNKTTVAFGSGESIVDFSTSQEINVKTSVNTRIFRGAGPVRFPANAARPMRDPEPYSGPWWFKQNDLGKWSPYDQQCSLALQKARVFKQPRVTLPVKDGLTYYIDFESMKQINANTDYKRKVKHEQWQWWCDEKHKYVAYDDATSTALENAYTQGLPTCRFAMSSAEYEVHFATGLQWRFKTGFKRKIRREGMHPPPLITQVGLDKLTSPAVRRPDKGHLNLCKGYEIISRKGGRGVRSSVAKKGMEWNVNNNHVLALLTAKKTLRSFQLVHDSAFRPEPGGNHVQIILNYTTPSEAIILTIETFSARQRRRLVDVLGHSLKRVRQVHALRTEKDRPAIRCRYYWNLLRSCLANTWDRRVLLARLKAAKGAAVWEVGAGCEFSRDSVWLPATIEKIFRGFLTQSVTKIRVSYCQGADAVLSLADVDKSRVRLRPLVDLEHYSLAFLAKERRRRGAVDVANQNPANANVTPWLLFNRRLFNSKCRLVRQIIPLLKAPTVDHKAARERVKEGWAIAQFSVVQVWRWVTRNGVRFGCVTHISKDRGTFEGMVPATDLFPLEGKTPLGMNPALNLSQRFRNSALHKIMVLPGPQPLLTYGDKARVVFISDTHGRHRHIKLPPGRILIHGGDIVDAYSTYGSMKQNNSLPHQEAQLDDFLKWLSEHASMYEHIVLLPGNHDVILDRSKFKDPTLTHPSKGPGPRNSTGWDGRGPTREEHARAMSWMLPVREGGRLPNNCVFVGDSSAEILLPTGVGGKVLRLFASPICKQRNEDHHSGAFCWGSESEKGLSRRVGDDFMVLHSSRKRDPRTLLRASPDLEINSTEGDGDLEPFLLKNGTPVTVMRWEIAKADDETETLFGYVRFQLSDDKVLCGFLPASRLQDLQPGKLAVVKRLDNKNMRTGLRCRATTSLDRSAMFPKHRSVRPGARVRIRETVVLGGVYMAKIQTNLNEKIDSDNSGGWIRCTHLQQAGVFDRERLWRKIPDGGVDILVTHTPPRQVLSDFQNGCKYLAERIQDMVRPPRYHLFGHEHRFKHINCCVHGTGSRPLDFCNGSLRNDLPDDNNNVASMPANTAGRTPIVFDYDLRHHHVYKRPVSVLALCLCRVFPALAKANIIKRKILKKKSSQHMDSMLQLLDTDYDSRKGSALSKFARKLNFLRVVQVFLGSQHNLFLDLNHVTD